jgi:DNA-directed RNA polymerase subunit beta'
VGLKENVIIGKLIPAGTGIADYRSIEVGHTELPEQALPADIAEFLASTESYEGDGSWGFESGWGFEDFPGDTASPADVQSFLDSLDDERELPDDG